jgi:hypothetical protein
VIQRTVSIASIASTCVLVAVAGVCVASAADPATAADEAVIVVCNSKAGERQSCPADTSAGVTLVESMGPGGCELGVSWGWDQNGVWVAEGCNARFSLGTTQPKRRDPYVPGAGFKLIEGEQGELHLRVFTYVRYLNQEGLDPTFTDSFGNTRTIQRRQDFQLNKAQVNFYGWALSERLRYLAYVWSANTSQGQSGQVVVAGNVSYEFNRHMRLGGGIGALPGVRSTEGNFPYWLSVDNRQIADEFFRPSYTTGIWADGAIAGGFAYHVMLGNNISQFGIDASQLDNSLSTWSGALTWEPMGAYGRPFGDYEHHDSAVTRFAVHLTTSDENRQSQPDTDAFDNVQIRISDGNVIFAPNLFAPDTQIDEATYNLASLDAGLKYRGFSLEGEYYWRKVDQFVVRGPGVLPFRELEDDGFQVQASAMILPKALQVYGGGSNVFGEFGDPWDYRAGINWYPWKNQAARFNLEYLELRRSPVGATSLPYTVGGNGTVVYTNFMIWL